MTSPALRWLTLAAMLLLAHAAHAIPTLRFTVDGGLPITCADGTACDSNATVGGNVMFFGSLGAFISNVAIGITKPSALPGPSVMNLTSINVLTQNGPHTLTIEFSETDFLSSGRLMAGLGGILSAPAGSAVTFRAFVDAANALFAQTTPIVDGLTFGPGTIPGVTSPTIGTPAGPYSLTQVINLSFTGMGSFVAGFDLSIPEPSTLCLTVLGFGALAFSRHKTRL